MEIADDYQGFYCYGCGVFVPIENALRETEVRAIDLNEMIQALTNIERKEDK